MNHILLCNMTNNLISRLIRVHDDIKEKKSMWNLDKLFKCFCSSKKGKTLISFYN